MSTCAVPEPLSSRSPEGLKVGPAGGWFDPLGRPFGQVLFGWPFPGRAPQARSQLVAPPRGPHATVSAGHGEEQQADITYAA
jgi:hypothetical protein